MDGSDDEIRERGVVKRTGGGHFGIQVDGADEDDDLMTVKRVNHGMDGDSDEEEEDDEKHLSAAAKMALADGPADLGAALRARAKKGKLRIKDGGHGGNARVVFDEDGEAMEPLEALGARDAGPVPGGRRRARRGGQGALRPRQGAATGGGQGGQAEREAEVTGHAR